MPRLYVSAGRCTNRRGGDDPRHPGQFQRVVIVHQYGTVPRYVGLVEVIERRADIDASAARAQLLAESDSTYGFGQRRRSQYHIRGQLRPGRQRAVDLDQRRRAARR